MHTYQIYHRTINDFRAPSSVFLDEEYTWAGELQAGGVKDLMVQLQSDAAQEEMMDNRELRIGDLVKCPVRGFMIFTPSGVWATVEVFEAED